MREYDLVAIGAWLNKHSLMDKPFASFSKEEIENLCNAVHLATIPVEYRVPYLEKGELVFPSPTHPRFAYWADGQTLFETLKEMGADPETVSRYCNRQHSEKLPQNKANK